MGPLGTEQQESQDMQGNEGRARLMTVSGYDSRAQNESLKARPRDPVLRRASNTTSDAHSSCDGSPSIFTSGWASVTPSCISSLKFIGQTPPPPSSVSGQEPVGWKRYESCGRRSSPSSGSSSTGEPSVGIWASPAAASSASVIMPSRARSTSSTSVCEAPSYRSLKAGPRGTSTEGTRET